MERQLRNWNLAAAGLHGAALLTFALLFRNADKTKRMVKMQVSRIPTDAATNPAYSYDPCDNVIDYPLVNRTATTHDPAKWLSAFFGVTLAAHLFYAWNPRGLYTNAVLGKGWNPFRWVE